MTPLFGMSEAAGLMFELRFEGGSAVPAGPVGPSERLFVFSQWLSYIERNATLLTSLLSADSNSSCFAPAHQQVKPDQD